MATILSMIKNFQKLDTDQMVVDIMEETSSDLNDLNLEQIYDGKTNTGEDIHPTYLEDPYFKGNLIWATGYSDWKDKITPNPRRTRFVPNLFINGYYHRSRSVSILAGGRILFHTTAQFAKGFEEKYANLNGLGGKYKREFLSTYVSPVFKQRMLEATGLLMK